MFPWVPYDEALNIAGFQKLNVRRERLTDKLFNEIVSNDSHRLRSLLPPRNMNDFSLRNKHKFNANFRTEQHKSTPVPKTWLTQSHIIISSSRNVTPYLQTNYTTHLGLWFDCLA